MKKISQKTINILVLFALEGILFQFTGAINNFGNNLFATNLGATDSQIGLIQLVPNLVAMLLMLPLGVLADKAKNTRVIPIITLFTMAFGYIILSLVPISPVLRMPLFFFALSFSVGSTVLYNAQWQNFFGDAVIPAKQTDVLTCRNRFMFIIGIVAPIICGVFMGMFTDPSSKLWVLQIFFAICAVCAISQAFVLFHIPVADHNREQFFTHSSITTAINAIFSRREFLCFFIPAIYFYITWQIDWSMWYIEQVDYLGLSETQMSVYNGILNIGMLVAVGIVSRVALKKGVDLTIILAPIGLISCPLIMIFCTRLPQPVNFIMFTFLMATLNSMICAVNICVVQILLKVSPVEHRSMAISIYTLSITFTNCIIPYIGVKIYELMGSNYSAVIKFNILVFLLRIIAVILFVIRLRYINKAPSDVAQGL